MRRWRWPTRRPSRRTSPPGHRQRPDQRHRCRHRRHQDGLAVGRGGQCRRLGRRHLRHGHQQPTAATPTPSTTAPPPSRRSAPARPSPMLRLHDRDTAGATSSTHPDHHRHRHQRRPGRGREHGRASGRRTRPATGNVLTNDTDVDIGDTRPSRRSTARRAMSGHRGRHLRHAASSTPTAATPTPSTTPRCGPGAWRRPDGHRHVHLHHARHRRRDQLDHADGHGHRHQRRAGGGRRYRGVQEDVTTSATGNVLTNDTDVDTGDTKTVSAVNGSAGNVGARRRHLRHAAPSTQRQPTPTRSTTHAAVQALAAGQTVTDTFTYTMRDTRRHQLHHPHGHGHRHQRRAGGGGRFRYHQRGRGFDHRQRADQRHRCGHRRHQGGRDRQRVGGQCRRRLPAPTARSSQRRRQLHLHPQQRRGRPGAGGGPTVTDNSPTPCR